MNGKRLRHPSLPKYNFGVHFLTAVTYRRIPYFRVAAWARIFCQNNLEQARREMGFHVLAFVLMPDHVHLLVWWDPEAHPQLTISTSSPVANSWRKSDIHANPVRDGRADTAEAYPWSSTACYAGLPSTHGVTITPLSEVFP